MKVGLHTLAALALTAHMVLGCCLHHVHGHGPLSGPPLSGPACVGALHAAHHAQACEPFSHTEQTPGHHGRHADHRHPHLPCHEGRCVFLRPDSWGDQSGWQVFPGPCSFVAGQWACIPRPAVWSDAAAGCESSPRGVLVTPYVLNQTFLL